MIRLLLRIGIDLVDAALALLIAGWLVEGFTVHPGGFVVAVLVFTAAQAILAPAIFNLARQHASAILGGIGLVSTLVALWVATLFPGGIQITTMTAWMLSPLVVWLITALGGWILSFLIIDKWWSGRAQRTSS